MLFQEEDAGLLKSWIVKRLENTSDADADVLADYVLALLRHEGAPEEVRALCEEEIPDFLKEDSAVFLDDVFAALTYKSYLPGAPPPPAQPLKPPVAQLPQTTSLPAAPTAPTAPAASTAPRQPTAGAPPFNPQRPNPRKRSFQDRGEPDGRAGNERGNDRGHWQGRAFKQPRRFGVPGAGPQYGGPAPGSFPNQSGHPTALPGLALMAIPDSRGRIPEPSAQLPTLPGMDIDMTSAFAPPGFHPAARGQQPKRRQRCRDYDRQGFCARGNTCMYEHGPPVSGYVPPMPLAPPQIQLDGKAKHAIGGIWPPPSFLGHTALNDPQPAAGYDPTTAALVLPSSNGHMALPPALPMMPPFPTDSRPGVNANDSRGQGRPIKKARGGARSQLSADGPNHDKSKTTIVVENIPEEKFSEADVRGFFSQFGNIATVSMQPYKRLALVKYEKWHMAQAAYKSPKVVFDNRFVRIFWFNGDNVTLAPPSTTSKGPAGAGNGSSNGGATTGKEQANGHGSSGPANGEASGEPDIDMDEFARKQAEAQKAFEEKKRKKEEVERMRLDLEQRQKALLAQQEEEKKKLRAKLAAASTNAEGGSGGGGSGSRKDGDSSSPEITFSKPPGGDPSGKPAASGNTAALRAQLAALEEEAKSMGLNPEMADDDSADAWGAGAPSFRGGARGAGGGYGSYRGRGRGAPFRGSGYTPRGGFRGGYRGRGGGGGGHAAYSAFSIDNRPKKVAVTGVDFTEPEKDEKLRQYLLGIGEFTDIQTTAAVTRITFADRRTAEGFFFGPAGSNKRIPGVDGQVELAWLPNSSSSSSSTNGQASASAAASSFSSTAGAGDARAAADGSSAGNAAAGGGGKPTPAADEDVVMSSTRDDESAAAAGMDYENEVPAEDQDWDVA